MNRKRATNALVGSPVERLEDFRFLTGRGQYIDDLVFEHTLHAVIVRSPVAHGRLRAVEKQGALARPGHLRRFADMSKLLRSGGSASV